MKADQRIEKKLEEYVSKGHLVPRTENNAYLKCSYKGTGGLISQKWNVKIYNTGSIVCNDMRVS